MGAVDPSEASSMRAAESAARGAKLRVWKGYAKPNLGNIDADFEACVVESSPATRSSCSSSGTEARVSLSSIKAPRLGNAKQSRKEPWSPESGGAPPAASALPRARRRTVDVSVADMDRNGVGLGGIRLLPEDEARATTSRPSARAAASRCPPSTSTTTPSRAGCWPGLGVDALGGAWAKLEATAKDLKLGLWADEKNREEAEKVAEPKEPPKAKTFRAKVADITDGSSLHLAEVTEAGATPKLDAVLAKMAGFAGAADPAATYWRNAVLEVDKEAKTYKIKFLDFGNVDYGVTANTSRRWTRATPRCPTRRSRSASRRPGAVARGRLRRGRGEDGPRARWGQDLTVTEVFVRGAEKKMVALKLASAGDDDKTASGSSRRASRGSQGLQEAARSSRAGVWRYGDCDSDDEK
ncbi:hypothetical protein JL722_14686 [Aureococcus anophagefferens]|nr:hypothetical protein JL722_14686 [Aureococcus anophagefferens]